MSLLPGDSFADILMFLTLVRAMDILAEEHDSLYVVVAGHTQFLACGKRGEIEKEAFAATARLIELLEGPCGLTVSTNKLALIINESKATRGVVKMRPMLKGASAMSTRNLGLDYAAGNNYAV